MNYELQEFMDGVFWFTVNILVFVFLVVTFPIWAIPYILYIIWDDR